MIADNWWRRPFRVVQTNIPEPDAAMDVDRVTDDILALGANVWLLNTAGIVAYYPSRFDFQHPSEYLARRPSGDLIGDAVETAHRKGIRVISRFDFSKCHREVYTRHPDWFYVSPKGEPQVYNGLYSTCPSGPYYQEKLFDVIREVMTRYPVDGIFFNMFGFAFRDYSGVFHGLCQCIHCQRRFRERFGAALPKLPEVADPTYRNWQVYSRETLEDLGARIQATIDEQGRDVGFFAYPFYPFASVPLFEVNGAVDRPLPFWRHGAGDAIRRSRTSRPDAPVDVMSVYFVDIPYRFAAEQPGFVGAHLAQTVANGANLHIYFLGTTVQRDRKGFGIVRDVFQWQARPEIEALYGDMESLARVCLIYPGRTETHYAGSDANRLQSHFRGHYRALAEVHVPFDVLPDRFIVEQERSGRLGRYACLILPNAACLSDEEAAAIDRYVRNGGGVVASFDTGRYDEHGELRRSPALECLGVEEVEFTQPSMRAGYFQTRAPGELPGMPETELVLLDKTYHYVRLSAGAETSLALILPDRYGPPEKCFWDPSIVETDRPGVVWNRFGRGRAAYFPWEIGRLFHDYCAPEHRALIAGAIARVAGEPVGVETNAPACVEITVHRDRKSGRTLIHLVNYSGNQDKAWHDPLPIRDLALALPLDRTPKRAWAGRLGRDLPMQSDGQSVRLTLPELGLFEVVVLE